MSNDLDKPQDGMPTVRWDDDTGATTPNRLGSTTAFGVGVGQRDAGAYAPRLFVDSRQQGKMDRLAQMCAATPEERAKMQAEYDCVWTEEKNLRMRNVLVEKAALALLQGYAASGKRMTLQDVWQMAANFVIARPEEFKYD